MMAATTCLDCGRISCGSRCPPCQSARIRAYDAGRGSSYQSPEWRALSAAVRASLSVCHWCGKQPRRLVADHVLSIRERPDLALDRGNAVPACVSCNNGRGSSGGAPSRPR
jgi:5-methylcytosine-specific restriction endonuclease McrA